MASMASVALLFVDADARELLGVFPAGQRAGVRAATSAAEARAAIRERRPDVIVANVMLPDEDGFSLLSVLRADPSTEGVPAIAVTGLSDGAAGCRALDAGFRKVVTKPLDTFMLTAAIASVADVAKALVPEETDDERTMRLIAEHNFRPILAELNAATAYRYTSILRFSGDRLESVWTFDCANPGADPFPTDLLVEASYCSLVRLGRAPFALTNADDDARVATHPKRAEIKAYCGVPIFRDDGSLFGTLCHYDAAPHPIPVGALSALERVARMLVPILGSAADDVRLAGGRHALGT